VVVPVPGRPDDIGFGTLESAAKQWLPRVWPTLWPILLILAAIWLVGWALVRFRPQLTAIRAVRATP
jgi:hypothetical protein